MPAQLSPHDKSEGEDDDSIVHARENYLRDDTSSHSSKRGGRKTGSKPIDHEKCMVHHETIAVNRSKLLVYFSLMITAVVAGGLTYHFATLAENSVFQDEFLAFSRQLIDSSETNAQSIFGHLYALTVIITSYGMNSNETWPFISLPNFDQRSFQTESNTGAELLIFSPVVPVSQKEAWENYTWDRRGLIQTDVALRGPSYPDPGPQSKELYPLPSEEGGPLANNWPEHEIYVPAWQLGPVPINATIVNLDLHTHPALGSIIDEITRLPTSMLSSLVDMDFLYRSVFQSYIDDKRPRSFVLKPVLKDFYDDSPLAGILFATIEWNAFFEKVLPDDTNGILVSIENTCGSQFTYLVNGREATYIGDGDLHDSKYDGIRMTHLFVSNSSAQDPGFIDPESSTCYYVITTYPTDVFEASYHTNQPIEYAFTVVSVFVLTSLIFFFYDWTVARRQRKVLSTAQRTTAIVSSMFPGAVMHRVLEEVDEKQAQLQQSKMQRPPLTRKRDGSVNRKSLSEHHTEIPDYTEHADALTEGGLSLYKTKPIADLFPETTVMFADLVGFTAWSSARDPVQVFTLLETIYHAFDEIAKRRRVFKVETVGDCYVAVVGLPDPRPDHAVVMARFARECLFSMHQLTETLEILLGPETTDLGMRFGLHSGPVTAGVLRGERSRFQLFGDTMNTTARIETTGRKNRIHLSSETAALLKAAGKEHWLRRREDKVHAKGKGELQTFWLETSLFGAKVEDPEPVKEEKRANSTSTPAPEVLSPKLSRLVDWNKDLLARFLKEIVSMRIASRIMPDMKQELREMERSEMAKYGAVLDEVEEIVFLPKFDRLAAAEFEATEEVQISSKALEQLREYLESIALAYHDLPFHNFEHASHVTMSVVKLLSRIIVPNRNSADETVKMSALHDHTYGITSDPLTQFAVVFSAIIHDVDHPGVSNSQLVKEKASMAIDYDNKSVAEQNSVKVAWDILMQERFELLRHTIYATKEEYKRFRTLVVNCVMATDVLDKDLNALRRSRWERAFSKPLANESHEVTVNRKATIVLEHLIQASDVAHLMQHWHVYRKWNEKFFYEMQKAYQEKRADMDPALNWYKGEISFFDFYIIPLAKKLKDCGVFGVSSSEYLAYAMQNRDEWVKKGQSITMEMAEESSRGLNGENRLIV